MHFYYVGNTRKLETKSALDAELLQIVAVFGDRGFLSESFELFKRNKPLLIGDLFEAGNLNALTLLDCLDVAGSFLEGIVSSGVEPGKASIEQTDFELIFLKLGNIDIGDLVLSPLGEF